MLHVFHIFEWLTNVSGVWFPFWLRLPAIMADVGSVLILFRILDRRLHDASIRGALLMFAAAPALILISGFHGNTDSVMLFFLLLSVALLERGLSGRAGLSFGLAMCFKIVPVIALPVIYLYQSSVRKRIAFLGAAGIMLLVSWSPYLLQSPGTILRHVFGYGSYYGHWGISYLALQLGNVAPPSAWVSELLRPVGPYLLLASIPLVSVYLRRSGATLYDQVGFIFFWFLAFTSGFGVQYLAWLVPWTVGLGAIPSGIFYAASGAFLFLVYNYWSQGMPWYLADSNRIGDYQGHYDYFQLLCWVTTILLLLTAHQQIRGSATPRVGLTQKLHLWSQITAPNRTLAVVLAVAVLIGCPFLWQVHGPAGNHRARVEELTAIRAAQYLDLSVVLYQRHRYLDAIRASETALQINPQLAEAYNNISAAYGAQGSWDLSVYNAQKALAIKPGFELALSNLRWAMQRKEAESHDSSGRGR
jgi:tetratricopeptide (TPR) repeat protein